MKLPPPDIEEEAINALTKSSVPEGIWYNKNVSLEHVLRVFGSPPKKDIIFSLEVKRIYRRSHIKEMAFRAVTSCTKKVVDTFAINHHGVAFVLAPELAVDIVYIKKELIRHVRKSRYHCPAQCLSVYIVLGNYEMMYFS